MQPLIVSLKLDQDSFEILNDLRQRHFPSERNFLDAHVTLFHALPGEQEAAVLDTLREVAGQTPCFPVLLPSVRSLGRGVAIEIESEPLVKLRSRLASVWSPWLTPQDRQGYRPHVTIQNKVSAEQARSLYEELSAQWSPLTAEGNGLWLWRYLNGPWEFIAEISFLPKNHDLQNQTLPPG